MVIPTILIIPIIIRIDMDSTLVMGMATIPGMDSGCIKITTGNYLAITTMFSGQDSTVSNSCSLRILFNKPTST